tara:strand:+ start:324 stop:464 length:141 start_codon:yes stop_codon:yes gene_type:complete
MKDKFLGLSSKETPIFDMLLVMDKNNVTKLLSIFKKKKKINNKTKK